jgi:diguanylate cyclase (GGDEF)-like protein
MFSLLMIDCDHFKKINDTWGHAVGDEVLITIVRICRNSIRETDAVFRWGGEEFLILLPETGQDYGRVAVERAAAGVGDRGNLA